MKPPHSDKANYTPLIRDAGDFGKVAVLLGGRSAEREISLKSGNAVLAALKRRGVNAVAIDAGDDVLQQLEQGQYDRAFIALHGRGGEDGVIQGVLEVMGIPYTGSGVLGSSLSMDKLRTKQLWRGAGLPTPPYMIIDQQSDYDEVVKTVGLPMAIKPVNEGSSLGITRVMHTTDIADALKTAQKLDHEVLAEKWISGAEYTAAILAGEALPLIRIETPRGFYDYEAKYLADDTRFICPCGLGGMEEEALQILAVQAFETLGCTGWGRIDFICDKDNNPWLIEANTIPGMTDHSLVPQAARAAGIEFDELVWRILETSVVNQTRMSRT
jgi:D-alanine-D-alanine ligase